MRIKTITSKKAKQLDALAQERYGVPAIMMMELAGIAVFKETQKVLRRARNKSVAVVCGAGNNGGDGFVAARHLYNEGVAVCIFVVGDRMNIKNDAKMNYDIVQNIKIKTHAVKSKKEINKLRNYGVIVDAIFGIGLARDVAGIYREVIEGINSLNKTVIAVDIPSGLDADTGLPRGIAVKAATTVTMAAAKKGFYVKEGPKYAGKIVVADIGWPRGLLK